MLLIASRESDLPGPERRVLGRAAFHSHDSKIFLVHPNPSLHEIFFRTIRDDRDEETRAAFLLFGTKQFEFVVIGSDSCLVLVLVLRGIQLRLDQLTDDLAANVTGPTL